MDSHPYNAPMCFLKPTPYMRIKISRYVDHNGKIYMPYLHDWSPNTSDLLSLIGVLIMHFSEEPPLYQVPRNNAPAPVSSTPYPTQSFMPMPGTSSTPVYPPYSSAQPPYPIANQNIDYQQQPYLPYPAFPKTNPVYPPSFPYPSGTSTTGSDNTGSSTGTGTGTITEEHIHASLLSAVEDKVRRRLREQLSQTQAELETLDKIQQELMQGKNRLDHLIAKLDAEHAEWEKNLAVLRDKEQELDESISKLSEKGGIDVDEAVTTTAPLYKQLLNAFAEEAATEDVIYYLGEALRRGVIDLDVFLKHVRSLSHKQFMLRALMQKCRAKAGLAG
uniref:Uncharacterized protein n=1 Tax=Pediculus humanus subsp. corporis TaxID=121224 RepID=A0A1S4MY01_PEDHC